MDAGQRTDWIFAKHGVEFLSSPLPLVSILLMRKAHVCFDGKRENTNALRAVVLFFLLCPKGQAALKASI